MKSYEFLKEDRESIGAIIKLLQDIQSYTHNFGRGVGNRGNILQPVIQSLNHAIQLSSSDERLSAVTANLKNLASLILRNNAPGTASFVLQQTSTKLDVIISALRKLL